MAQQSSGRQRSLLRKVLNACSCFGSADCKASWNDQQGRGSSPPRRIQEDSHQNVNSPSSGQFDLRTLLKIPTLSANLLSVAATSGTDSIDTTAAAVTPMHAINIGKDPAVAQCTMPEDHAQAACMQPQAHAASSGLLEPKLSAFQEPPTTAFQVVLAAYNDSTRQMPAAGALLQAPRLALDVTAQQGSEVEPAVEPAAVDNMMRDTAMWTPVSEPQALMPPLHHLQDAAPQSLDFSATGRQDMVAKSSTTDQYRPGPADVAMMGSTGYANGTGPSSNAYTHGTGPTSSAYVNGTVPSSMLSSQVYSNLSNAQALSPASSGSTKPASPVPGGSHVSVAAANMPRLSSSTPALSKLITQVQQSKGGKSLNKALDDLLGATAHGGAATQGRPMVQRMTSQLSLQPALSIGSGTDSSNAGTSIATAPRCSRTKRADSRRSLGTPPNLNQLLNQVQNTSGGRSLNKALDDLLGASRRAPSSRSSSRNDMSMSSIPCESPKSRCMVADH